MFVAIAYVSIADEQASIVGGQNETVSGLMIVETRNQS